MTQVKGSNNVRLKAALRLLRFLGLKKCLKIAWYLICEPRQLKRFLTSISSRNTMALKQILFTALHSRTTNQLKFNSDHYWDFNKRYLDSIAEIHPKTRKFSIIIPVFHPNIPLLLESIESCKKNTWPEIEVILVCDGLETTNGVLDNISNVIDEINIIDFDQQELQLPDEAVSRHLIFSKVRLIGLNEHVGISKATQIGTKMIHGDVIVLLDQDDLLHPLCLEILNSEIIRLKLVNNFLLYSNNVKISFDGVVVEEVCKPSWSPIFDLQLPYVGHIKAFSSDLIKKCYDTQLVLQNKFIGDHAAVVAAHWIFDAKIHRVPAFLAAWRMSGDHSIAQNPMAKFESSYELVEIANKIVSKFNFIAVKGTTPTRAILVSEFADFHPTDIIIPTAWKPKSFEKLLRNIMSIENNIIRVILVDTKISDRPKWFVNLLSDYSDRIIVLEDSGKFNYARCCNTGIKVSTANQVILLNDDILPFDSTWISKMQAHFRFPNIGVVGVQLLYPDGRIQHNGVFLNPNNGAEHKYLNALPFDPHLGGSLQMVREVTAVTAACLMISRDVLNRINNLSEEYEDIFQDVDLCLRVRQVGFSIVIAPDITLGHLTSATRGMQFHQGDLLRLKANWDIDSNTVDPFTFSINNSTDGAL